MFRSSGGVTSNVESTDGCHVSEGVPRNHKSSSKTSENLVPGENDNDAFGDAKAAVSSSVARAPSNHNLSISHFQPDQSRSVFFLSMIEERCRKEAANALNCGRNPSDMLSEDHEDVEALATNLYHGVSQEMTKHVQLPSEITGPQGATLRKELLSGFDTILSNAARSMSLQSRESPSASRSQMKANSSLAVLPLFPNSSAVSRVTGNTTESTVMLYGNGSLFGGPKSVYRSEYQELGLLGKGGYGEVYRVRNHLDNQEYAVKKIILASQRLQKSQENEQIDALLAELRTLAQLNHTNVVRYYHGWLETYTKQALPTKPKEPKLLAATQTNSSTWDLSEGAYDATTQELSSAMAFEADHAAHRMYEEALDRDERDYDDNIVFGYSTGSRSASHEIDRERNVGYPGPISRATFRASLLSVGEEGTDPEIEDIPRNFSSDAISLSKTPLPSIQPVTAGLGQVQYPLPDHILFIKMSLHPLTLLTYLSPEQPKPGDTIKLRHCFHLDSSVGILSAILDGVEYLHSQKFVHRDLKPANIFLSVHENQASLRGFIDTTACSCCSHLGKSKPAYITPCIGDFGLIAEIKEPTAAESSSSAQPLFQPSPLASLHQRPVGTHFYRPSKMPKREPIICPKLDVYSLGIIAMELIHKFTTKSERVTVLTNLSNGILPPGFDEHPMAEGIKSMVRPNRDKRWDLCAVRQWLDRLRENDIGKGKGKYEY
jgi:eukaryotic translation initiation factor 2-alpha kinase 3